MIIETFNYVYFLVVGVTVILAILLYFLLKNKSDKVKIIVLSSISTCNVLFFFLYKYWLSIDQEYLSMYNLERFNWWSELPLHLCNISMFMIPLGLIFKNNLLKSYVFFISPIAAFMAITFPEAPFTNSNVFLLRNIGFYGTHILIIITGINLVPLKLYRPTYKGFILPIITAGILACVMFVVNTILRNTGSPEANYFFTYYVDLPILSTFYNICPVPLLYEVFVLIIIVPYCLFVTYIINLIEKLKFKKVKQ